MTAPKGNQFWKLRSKHGRDKLFATPELLWQAACEYFEWCDKHPWVNKKTKVKPNGTETEEVPVQRPYSLSGLCIYLGVNTGFWWKFKGAGHKDFLSVVSIVEEIIETQQLEGATVGAFNANIVARKLGLKERTDLTSNDERIYTTVKVKVIGSKEEISNE